MSLTKATEWQGKTPRKDMRKTPGEKPAQKK